MTNISRMTDLPKVVGVTSMFLTAATGAVAQTVPPNVPGFIICYAQSDQSWRVGYLSRVNKTGDALYLSADGKVAATITAKGGVVAPINLPASLDCYGKTLEELRSNGRLSFQPSK